jgi:hypothetical protein
VLQCQGMTLDRVSLHLGSVFAHGQAYVALSRIRCLQSLSIQDRFDPHVINAHPKALKFYDELRKKLGKAAEPIKTKPEVHTGKATPVSAPPQSAEEWEEYDVAALIDEDTRREERVQEDVQRQIFSQSGGSEHPVMHMGSPPLEFLPASRFAAAAPGEVKVHSSSSPPVQFPLSQLSPGSALRPPLEALHGGVERKPQPRGERDEIDLLSDDDEEGDSAKVKVKGESGDAVKMEVEPGESASMAAVEMFFIGGVQEEAMRPHSPSSSPDFAAPSQPGSTLPPAPLPRGLNFFSTARAALTAASSSSPPSIPASSLVSSSSSSSPSPSSSSSPRTSPGNRLSASTRLSKPLHSLHPPTAPLGPLLRAHCRPHGEPLTGVMEKREGEAEPRRPATARMGPSAEEEGESEAGGPPVEGEPDSSEPSTFWLYRCARGCALSIST